MYDRVQGEVGVRNLVDKLYWLIMADQELSHFFSNANMTHLKVHMTKFISQLLGGPIHYDGRELSEVHMDLGITFRHFNRVADLLLATMLILDVPPDIKDHVLSSVGAVGDSWLATGVITLHAS